jgi:hypothetical protein
LKNRFAVAALVASLAVAGGALAAAPVDRVLPVAQYTTEKGRALGQKYEAALQELNAGIYHCMPWLDVPRQSIGFFKPKHLQGDERYLSLRVYVEQDPSPQFTALGFEARASSMFSRYVGEMLRRMTQTAGLLTDRAVDGFTVIVGWLKDTTQGGRPVHETIAVFAKKAAAADYLTGRAKISDLAGRTVVLGYDGDKPLGELKLRAWEDNFLQSFQVANYQPEPGVSCVR